MNSASLDRLSSAVHRLQGKRDQITQDILTGRRKLKELTRGRECCEKALAVAQEVARLTQEELEYRISDIVTAALAAVFPDPYEFKLIFEIKRGKTEARPIFMRDGKGIDPLTAAGGGVVDVAAFALRLSCYLIMRDRPQPLFVLDEPFRFVSREYQVKVADLLEELAERLGVQFLIVTHEEELERGNVLRD